MCIRESFDNFLVASSVFLSVKIISTVYIFCVYWTKFFFKNDKSTKLAVREPSRELAPLLSQLKW